MCDKNLALKLRRFMTALGLLAMVGTAGAEAPGGYRIQSKEIDQFIWILDKACQTPGEYQRAKGALTSTSSSATAKANQLVTPYRSVYQIVGTDLMAYESWYPQACPRVAKLRECSRDRTLSAEQACDCAAGYPGDVETGIGAGERITATSRDLGMRACQAAVANASGETRARYLAQLGRAQLYKAGGTYDGFETLKQAIAAGYRRAEIDVVRAYARDVEYGGDRTPQATMQKGLAHLPAARAAGAREAASVVESVRQIAAVKQWNADFFRAAKPFFDADPPRAEVDPQERERRRRAGLPSTSPSTGAPTTPIGGSNGLYGCASPPCW